MPIGIMASQVFDLRWRRGIKVEDLVDMLGSVGFQATELKRAADLIIDMKRAGAKIFLSFTSNMVSSGLRGLFAQTIERGYADVVITTVGAVEEDFIKAQGGDFSLGSFEDRDETLASNNMNRIGNILVPSKSYELLDKTLHRALLNIINPGDIITPSELINRLGDYCKGDKNSILYQAMRRGVHIYCPAITDGSFGFQLQELRNNLNFQIDVVSDLKNIVFEASPLEKIGIIALGGGVAKHHAILSNITNGGADYLVYITTASPYSGSLSGATTREAISWGKMKNSGRGVTVHGDATIIFPLVMTYVFERVEGSQDRVVGND